MPFRPQRADRSPRPHTEHRTDPASERATRDYEQIAREILEQAAEIDAAEDEQFGQRPGDELPPAVSTREGRQRWLRDGELYRRRDTIIERVFADTKFDRRIDRFQRRGRAAARSEWRLITATHNLLKLHTHTLAATAA